MNFTATALVAAVACAAPLNEPQVDFAREILPILSDKCFVCHGPDPHPDTELRLDSRESATADRGGYRALDPQHPPQSRLLERIHSADDPMPPADAEKQLSDAEKQLLRKWVEQGGQYAEHWAFVAPRKEYPPNPQGLPVIDAFIAQGLAKAKTAFAPPADPRTLARRAALTLTGLPPEQDQLERYLRDPSPQAYQRLVDELLASPRFGEHQARYWLDAVRYGDTHGLHLDNRRGIYPYRDWVVRAFNENLPLDQFITWQIAGDLLPDPSLEQVLATGYVRLNPSTGEGGAIAEEFQAKNNFDRVETLGTVFLGMSLTCARCHTHKYDPITQTEYYRLLAFFNSTAEPALDGNSYTYGPTVRTPDDQPAWLRWKNLTEQRETLLRRWESSLTPAELESAVSYAQQASDPPAGAWRVTAPAALEELAASEDPAWSDAPNLPGRLAGKQAPALPRQGQAIRIQADLDVALRRTVWIRFAGGATSLLQVDGRETPHRADPLAGGRRLAEVDLAPGEHSLRIDLVAEQDLKELVVLLESPWSPLARAGNWSGCDPSQRLAMLLDPAGPWPDAASEEERRLGRDLESAILAAEAAFTTSLVARELPQPRTTRLLRRGEYNLPSGEPLTPDVPRIMGGLPESASADRLGLARWLTAREHPLVARVLVNRLWQRMFGAGLVRSPEDFGLQGRQPTHPQLLDWLAVELQDSGWNLKHMLRLMAASRTFQQHSAWRPELNDPENLLWARGPHYRLDAEVLRDVGLWASQLLDPHMGGEGVKPYQPDGMWRALAHPASNTKAYQRDQGERLYRRSLYVYWKRTSPHPMMTLFDAPDRESSCVRRSRTNTPLQSLGLLNETQRIEMAKFLAQRLLRECDASEQRVHRLFELLASRPARDAELRTCLQLLREMRRRYAEAPQAALDLLSIGEARATTDDPAELAAWTQLAVVVLASDPAIMMY